FREETVVVLPPRGHLLGGPRHDLEDLWLRLRLREQAQHLAAVQRIACHDIVDELHDLRALEIELRPTGMMWRARMPDMCPSRVGLLHTQRRQQEQETGQKVAARIHYELTSFRWE